MTSPSKLHRYNVMLDREDVTKLKHLYGHGALSEILRGLLRKHLLRIEKKEQQSNE